MSYLPSKHKIKLFDYSIINPDDYPDGICTYFVMGLESGRIKIGRTKNLKSRMSAINCDCSEVVIVVGIIAGDVEEEIHEKFSNYRIKGEWFDGIILGEVCKILDSEAKKNNN